MKTLPLSNGREIPCMGYGCYNAFGRELTDAVRTALDAGYQLIDSAEFYHNEEAVGAALAEVSGQREKLFVVSKAWPSSFTNLEDACANTLRNLKTDYLDTYLLHWPGIHEDKRLKAYETMLRLVEKGWVLAPGVSNFQPEQLEQLKETFGTYPAVNELECHPTYQQRELIRWCTERSIRVISYQPINRGADLSVPAVLQLAERHGRTPAQVILRWHLQREHLPIPKSVTPERIRENIALFDFSLSEEECGMLDALETGVRVGQDPYRFPDC